jgi:hypothetical protein
MLYGFIKMQVCITINVSRLVKEKGKKSSTDLLIERSVKLYGFTPDEKSDENLKWMRENGYVTSRRHKWGKRGRS